MRARPRADGHPDPGVENTRAAAGMRVSECPAAQAVQGQAGAHLRPATSGARPAPRQKRAGRRVSLRGPAWRISASMAEAGIGRAK